MSTRLHGIARPRPGYHADLEEARMRTRRQHAQNEARRAAMEGSEDRRGVEGHAGEPPPMVAAGLKKLNVIRQMAAKVLVIGQPRERAAFSGAGGCGNGQPVLKPGRRSSEPFYWRLAWHALQPSTWRFAGAVTLVFITLIAFHLAISNLAAGSCLLLGGVCLIGVGYTAADLRGYVPRWTRKGQR